MPSRIKTREGDWYVATSSRDWSAAFDRMQAQVAARDARMTQWELANWPAGSRFDSAYWEAYRAEKAKTPVEYPMPEGHVMFARTERHFCCEVCERNPTCGADCGSCHGDQFDPATALA